MAGIIAAFRRHLPVLVALNEMSGCDPQVGEAYREPLTDVIAALTAVIADGQAKGAIRPEFPAATTAHALTWMVERTCHQNLPTTPVSYDAELADVLTEITWGALYLVPMPPRQRD